MNQGNTLRKIIIINERVGRNILLLGDIDHAEQGREDHHILSYKIHQEHYCKFWNEKLQVYKHILCQRQQNHEE